MSADAAIFEGVRVETAEVALDEELTEAARALLSGGPVCFKKSTRVAVKRFPRWTRPLYAFFCRRLPERRRVPPQPAAQRTVFTDWNLSVDKCETPDDQLLVMPLDRDDPADLFCRSIECRPKDPADARRFAALSSVFAGYRVWGESGGELLTEIGRDVDECRRMTRQLRT